MPIHHNVTNDTFFGTMVLMGSGDVGVAPLVNIDAKPIGGIILWQDVPKDVDEWGIDKPYTYNKDGRKLVMGHGVQIEFARVESLDILIKALQEVRSQVFESEGLKGKGKTN